MSDFEALFYWRGIAADYFNYKGEHVTIPLENKVNLLKVMGVNVDDPKSVEGEAYNLDVKPWLQWLPEFSVTFASEPSFQINLSPKQLDAEFKWSLYDAFGERVDSGDFVGSSREETGNYQYENVLYSRRKISISYEIPGYYKLQVNCKDVRTTVQIAIAPEHAFNPSWAIDNVKIWGVILHVYTLRSERNWGFGDFTDLLNLTEFLASKGAGVIGLNPLHALSADLESSFSPYTPSDRRFVNVLYIDVENIPGALHLVSREDRSKIEVLRSLEKVDYQAVAALKYKYLSAIFYEFIASDNKQQRKELFDYIRLVGEPLINFACYEASHQPWLEKWDASFFDSIKTFDEKILSLESGEYNHVLFYCYLQWIANKQLKRCQDKAEALGMEIGLVKDLAVGANGTGAEVSTNQALFRRNASVGAPPDPMALTGQNWGIPPMDPAALVASNFAHYLALIKANMVHCGALRIDHAMSLMRLWWCPPDQNADSGAYVYYPFRELLGLLCLESYLNHCVVIGEDLGVVPDEFRDEIYPAKIFSNKVFYFEKECDGRFRRPEHYMPHALAMVNNHDVPTLVSWWNATDLTLRHSLNLLEEGVELRDVYAAREADKQELVDLLKEYGVMPESWREKPLSAQADEDIVGAILLFASHSASQIFVLQMEDLLMIDEPINVPGTYREYPNWQRKLDVNIEDIIQNKRIDELLSAINEQRKN